MTRTFGIELEFFLADREGRPVIDSAYSVMETWHRRNVRAPLTHELSSFQIEINPGPWSLDRHGIGAAIDELTRATDALERCAATNGLRVSTSAVPARIDQQLVTHPRFFTDKPRYRASSSFFAARGAVLRWRDGSTLAMPGETAVGCLDEIHIHAQLENDVRTLALFNFLNRHGDEVCAPFAEPLVVNGAPLAGDCTTMQLFTEANGDSNRDGSLCRVGYLPGEIDSLASYRAIVDGFDRVPCMSEPPGHLDPVTTTYFWVRLRGEPGALRVEFRPMEMGADWQTRVEHLASAVLAFADRAGSGVQPTDMEDLNQCPAST